MHHTHSCHVVLALDKTPFRYARTQVTETNQTFGESVTGQLRQLRLGVKYYVTFETYFTTL